MPEKEIPPARLVDIYFIFYLYFLYFTHRLSTPYTQTKVFIFPHMLIIVESKNNGLIIRFFNVHNYMF